MALVNLLNGVSRRYMNNRKYQHMKECFPKDPYCTWMGSDFILSFHIVIHFWLESQYYLFYFVYQMVPGLYKQLRLKSNPVLKYFFYLAITLDLLRFNAHKNLQKAFKALFLGPIPRDSYWVGLEWNQKTLISNKLPGELILQFCESHFQ